MQTGMFCAIALRSTDFFDAVGEFYFADDLRRDNSHETEAFADILREAKSAFCSGSVTQIPVIEMRRR